MTNTSNLSGKMAQKLLEKLATWSNTTTIILHGGCVFEFKGQFPAGEFHDGYYNLNSGGKGFEGHIKLELIESIHFQDKLHRGKQSHAFVFKNNNGEAIFKVFLGRDEQGEIIAAQLSQYQKIQSTLTLEEW